MLAGVTAGVTTGVAVGTAPGVAEALLVGENKPYCVALLWIKEGCDVQAIDRAVDEANARLSHPEQVKRWAILANDLSIEGGDLTANLKLKRQAVARRCAGVIAALYGGESLPQSVLHLGGGDREG